MAASETGSETGSGTGSGTGQIKYLAQKANSRDVESTRMVSVGLRQDL